MAGAPQGSVSRPILFHIFNIELGTSSKNGLMKFVDDTSIVITGKIKLLEN